MKRRYIVRPRADRDTDRQAAYLAEHAGSEVAYRVLMAVRETFALLASHPEIGWRPQIGRKTNLDPFRMFSVSGFDKMLVLYRPIKDRVEICAWRQGARRVDPQATNRVERKPRDSPIGQHEIAKLCRPTPFRAAMPGAAIA